ncbi:MAG: hypothetical protein ACYDDO_07090 [Acidiferrobacterales bacterium]
MNRFLEISGALAGSVLGGWLGGYVGIVTSFVLGTLGAAVGVIAVRRFIGSYLG